jgi:GNAT superfamily N-acetyltransferase
MLARFTQIDYDREIALVAIDEESETDNMLGVARIIGDPDGKTGEFAVLVGDAWQGKGIGSNLLEKCLSIAEKQGFETVHGIVLHENRNMLALGKKLGFDIKREPDSGDNELVIHLMNQQHLDAVQAIEIACSNVETPLQRLEHHLQSWVAYLVLPLFALANSGLALRQLDMFTAIRHPVTLGVMLGLVSGKPLGIVSFTYLGFKLLQAPLLHGIKWSHIVGVSLLGGIGFTMSLFISGLSFTSVQLSDFSKLGIIAGSVVSGIAGWIVLGFLGRPIPSLPVRHRDIHDGLG